MLTNPPISPLLFLQAGLPKCRTRGLFLGISRLSTKEREYGVAKLVDNGRGNLKRPTRNTFASAGRKGGNVNGENLNKGHEYHMSGEDINTSRDWEKDEIVESLPEKQSLQKAKESVSYRKTSEYANKHPSGEVKTNKSFINTNTHTNGSPAPETNFTIRRYEIFGDSPQIRKAGLVRRVG
ncbi:uncharacterized protein EAF01_008260 [Botrytis porri]|uniref:Uncharacterized protein n=1 Tax=Botrytis porri TaxID=87229 RepID=A0A4Z1L743_9HELO|nr:uncharacterized protein EAF01_008260 [Botrytis porri]KAF7899047.1 hypothetical protein EAF01_008260 [Botrytis porri]TGO92567.1 hypothetical protein BPOR_0001g00520 [Botrytis porri]